MKQFDELTTQEQRIKEKYFSDCDTRLFWLIKLNMIDGTDFSIIERSIYPEGGMDWMSYETEYCEISIGMQTDGPRFIMFFTDRATGTKHTLNPYTFSTVLDLYNAIVSIDLAYRRGEHF